MLWQYCHQQTSDRNKVEMKAQCEFNDAGWSSNGLHFDDWVRQSAADDPPPDGWDALICNEGSEHFTWAAG